MMTCALGGGFVPETLYAEIITATSFQHVTREEMEWAILLLRDGGQSLGAYPEYHRIVWEDGKYRGGRFTDESVASAEYRDHQLQWGRPGRVFKGQRPRAD